MVKQNFSKYLLCARHTGIVKATNKNGTVFAFKKLVVNGEEKLLSQVYWFLTNKNWILS